MLSRLPTLLSTLLLAVCVDARPGFLILNNDPAPPPEKGPPASFYASRNKSHLPVEVCGIVGGYVLTVLIWGVLLLTVGRRMRRKTENSPKTLELQLVNARPVGKLPPTPSSARSATSWLKDRFKKEKSPSINTSIAPASPTSPVVHSPNSFDQKVLDSDRERAQADMERLYAAVMEHDRKKSYSAVSTKSNEVDNESTISKSRRPSNINIPGRPDSVSQSNPGSPIANRDVKAIYPPGYANPPQTAPLPPAREDRRPSSPRSVLSKKSHMSTNSTNSKTRFNLKNLRISGPIQKYPGESSDDDARTPLSPRFYNPGAPPSPPTQQNSPRSVDEAYEQLDEVQPLPHPAPQRLGSYDRSKDLSSQPSPAKSANSSTNALPLRGYNKDESLKSPGIQTTYIDRRREQLSLTSPKTGVPFTPYSPYMPFTPITPITPSHLVTRHDRKREKKINGRKKQMNEDMVQSPKEIFGDAW